ncbi:MAG: GNAT family N-acetyltransferase [Spirochaetaceae bacterium]|nr:GNAT family N-acetyltransferase [Spirochaetaceae bacterium]
MDSNVKIKELTSSDIEGNLLLNFNRYQKTDKLWTNESGSWQLVEEGYSFDWNKDKKESIAKEFLHIINNKKGCVFAAYNGNNLIGFAMLLNDKFGTNLEYVQLKYLHVSYEYRHQGIGKHLFKLCADRARELNTGKLYLSANDSEDTQRFYLTLGCTDAAEIDKKLAEAEPYDRQMEYIL